MVCFHKLTLTQKGRLGNPFGAAQSVFLQFGIFCFCNGPILSANNAVAYLLEGKTPIPGLTHTAYIIGVAEYLQLKDTDPEDTNPDPPDDPGDEVLTRAQLTAKVKELEETNTMLLECLLEMSETVYA